MAERKQEEMLKNDEDDMVIYINGEPKLANFTEEELATFAVALEALITNWVENGKKE